MKRSASRLISTLLVLCMALALLPGMALAVHSERYIVYPVTGGNIYFDPATGTVTDCDESVSVAIIPSEIGGVPVTSIGEWAFFFCHNLVAVTIPDSVITIGKDAFSGCSSLTTVTIPDSVTAIGEGAFNGCSSLHSVTIPASVTAIEEYTFYDSGLTSVTIPVSITRIGESALGFGRLTDVYYAGSESQWKQIAINTDGTNPLLEATIHYNSTGPAPVTGVSVTVGGKAVVWTDAAPFIDENDRTMVPLRAVADAMGLTVDWDAAAREAVFTDGSKTIYFPIGSTTARTSEGSTVKMDTAAVIRNDRTYAPIRYLAEYFGHEVGWDAATRTVIIK